MDAKASQQPVITIKGVRTNNLKSLDITIPHECLVVITGPSGSGKSSLVYDTLYSHAKRLYLDALVEKGIPLSNGNYQVENISGARPPVAMKQMRRTTHNIRSSVGGISRIDSFLRIIFARAGKQACPACFKPLTKGNSCDACGCIAEELTAQHFNHNHRDGMCLECSGLGKTIAFSEEMIIPDRSRSINWIWDNAEKGSFSIPNVRRAFDEIAKLRKIDLDIPYNKLNKQARNIVLNGDPEPVTIKLNKVTNTVTFDGIIGYLERQYQKTTSEKRRKALSTYLHEQPCPGCTGMRIRQESLQVTIGNLTYADLQQLRLDELSSVLAGLKVPKKVQAVLAESKAECDKRLNAINNLGLGYITLGTTLSALSDGELQRLHMAKHLGADLSGVMYLFDEPTAGLSTNESDCIIDILQELCRQGNSVIVVEHSENVIRKADYIIEIGPGAGVFGGELIYSGPINGLLRTQSTTSRSLVSRNKERIPLTETTEMSTVGPFSANNLQIEQLNLPVNRLIGVGGPSGCGKSTLLTSLSDQLPNSLVIQPCTLGKSRRSSIATYLGIMDELRELFAKQPAALKAGFTASNFSTNSPGGRCEECKGLGVIELEMHFLPNEFVTCSGCRGRQFSDEVLEVTLDGLSISDILALSISDAQSFFKDYTDSHLARGLTLLNDFGLGYLSLGTTTPTLSGGESQRIYLIAHLLSGCAPKSTFLFDQPSNGLHMADTNLLLDMFDHLLNDGHSVIFADRLQQLFDQCDQIIELGPGGGPDGGRVMAYGTPATLYDLNTQLGRQLNTYRQEHITSDLNVQTKTNNTYTAAPISP